MTDTETLAALLQESYRSGTWEQQAEWLIARGVRVSPERAAPPEPSSAAFVTRNRPVSSGNEVGGAAPAGEGT